MNKQLTVSVGLIERDSTFLVMRRLSSNPEWHHRWELPGGKIEPGETPEKALIREILEETGLKIEIPPRLLGVHTHHWHMTSGVTQQTFILLYHCYSPEGDVLLKPQENDAFSWEGINQIMQKEDLLDGITAMINQLFLRADADSHLPAVPAKR